MTAQPDDLDRDEPADPLTTGDLARESARVARAADGVWEVLGHAEAVAAATDDERFSSAVSAHLQVPNGLDGEEHRTLRALVDRYLSAERAEQAEPAIRDVARELVGSLLHHDEGAGHVRFDAVTELGARFAVRVQTRWLGWPEMLEQRLLRWMRENYAATRSGSHKRRVAVAIEFDRIIRSVLEPRREASRGAPDDITTELMADRSLGRALSDEEIVSILRNWTGGDLGSLALCAGVLVRFLAIDPELQERVRGGVARAEMAAIVDEVLRIDDPFVSSRRITTCPVELGGVEIEAGERVRINWTSANRDEAVFGDPERFDPHGNGVHNLVYGAGPHVCPGRALATTELCVLIEELLRGTSRVELDPAAAPVRAAAPVGGYEHVPVVAWRPTRQGP